MPYLPELVQCAVGTHRVAIDKTIMQNNALWCKDHWNERFARCSGPKCFVVIGAMWTYCSNKCAARARMIERDKNGL